ncbi:MAG TPA: VOC family protein [Aquihabitans sp.]|jgi:uncharacterized glyoxalase superfamily protein PhnB|nr:VOC family protein [Aquihabitans sp.]
MPEPAPTAWPCLSYDDARAAIAFLVDALGFEATAVYGEDPDGVVHHAELRWPLGGGVMLGSTSTSSLPIPAGTGAVYLVTDDPDAALARALAAGAEVVRDIRDEDFGSRDFIVRDPQGVHWSLGTYRGHAGD